MSLQATFKGSVTLISVAVLFTVNSSFAQTKVIPPSQWWQIIQFSPDGAKVAIHTPPPEIVTQKNHDGTFSKWQKPRPLKTAILHVKDNSVVCEIDCAVFPTWSPDSKYVCGNSIDSKNFNFGQAIYIATTGAKVRSFALLYPNELCWSPDSKRLFLTHREGASILDLEKKAEMQLAVKKGETYFRQPEWAPNGKEIAATLLEEIDAKERFILRIWNADSKQKKLDIKLVDGNCCQSWSPDGKYFLYSQPLEIKILDAQSLKPIHAIKTRQPNSLRFDWSPDGTKISYTDGNKFHILNLRTMSECSTLNGPTNGFFRHEWSHDSKFILISTDSTAAIFDALSGKCYGHKTWPDAEEFTIFPDQKHLVIRKLNDLTECEGISLPPVSGKSPFRNGKTGAPDWDRDASPKTIAECIEQFDKELSAENRKCFKETKTEMETSSYGGGSFITNPMMANVYGKWNRAELSEFFKQRGITDPRDVTGIMLVSYWRSLNNKPIELDGLIASHKAFWDSQRPVIGSNKFLSSDLLDCKLKNRAGTTFTIGEIKAKWRVVSFVDTDGYMSAEQLKCLKELRENSRNHNLAIIVCLVPPSSLTKEHWRGIQTKVMGYGDKPAQDIANFKSNCGDIVISEAPLELSQALGKFVEPGQYSQFGLPQTLVIDNQNRLKLRINLFEKDKTLEALKKVVDE